MLVAFAFFVTSVIGSVMIWLKEFEYQTSLTYQCKPDTQCPVTSGNPWRFYTPWLIFIGSIMIGSARSHLARTNTGITDRALCDIVSMGVREWLLSSLGGITRIEELLFVTLFGSLQGLVIFFYTQFIYTGRPLPIQEEEPTPPPPSTSTVAKSSFVEMAQQQQPPTSPPVPEPDDTLRHRHESKRHDTDEDVTIHEIDLSNDEVIALSKEDTEAVSPISAAMTISTPMGNNGNQRYIKNEKFLYIALIVWMITTFKHMTELGCTLPQFADKRFIWGILITICVIVGGQITFMLTIPDDISALSRIMYWYNFVLDSTGWCLSTLFVFAIYVYPYE